MPTYILHGFRWPRDGFTGVRVHAIVNNLEDCSVEYIQNENSKQGILESFRKSYPELMKELESNGRSLEFIEQYDPNDLTSADAVSQPHAFVADKVVEVGGEAGGQAPLSLNVDEVIAAGPGLSAQAWEALADLRDKIAQGEKIGWWVVYNGDPERSYDEDDEEDDDDEGGTTPTRISPDAAVMQVPSLSQQQAQTPTSTSQSIDPAATLAARTKHPSEQQTVQPHSSQSKIAVEHLPPPKKEHVPEPSKLKEIAQKTGFRKKFFGKKSG